MLAAALVLDGRNSLGRCPVTRGARLVAVGDLMLGDSPTCVGFGFRTRVSAARLADGLRTLPPLRGGEIVFGNLETPLSDVGAASGGWEAQQLRGAVEYAGALRDAGFTVLNVANNHAVQHGLDAFADSVARLERVGIHACGLRGAPPWTCRPIRLDLAAQKVGILGYCLRPRQYGEGPAPFAEGDPAEILADVRRLAAEDRAVIVSLHWGEEFVPEPSRSEVDFARRVIEAGACVIVGHHPHVSRPVVQEESGVIAYSLGNLAADMVWYEPLRHGIILTCRVRSRVVSDVATHQVRIGDSYLPAAGHQANGPAASVAGLDDEAYRRAVARTIAAQRRALYGYTLHNAWRFSPGTLAVLGARTMRNKCAGLFRRGSREPE